MPPEPLPPGCTEDAFLDGRLAIVQPKAAYRAGLDAVLLAAAAPLAPRDGMDKGAGERVLDAGAGVGTVGLCLAARVPQLQVTLVEREPELVALARLNAARNGLADRISVVAADLAAGGALAQGSARHPDLPAAGFGHALANPPFDCHGTARVPASRLKAAAHQMARGDLDRWLAFLATAVAAGGSLTLIHRTAALPAILTGLAGRFGDVRVLPVHPRADVAAIRVLVQARRGSRAGMSVWPGLVLHAAGTAFTPQAQDILRHGAALRIGPAD